MKKYIGGWSTTNGASYNQGYEFSNLKTAKKTMREIAKGNNTGTGARWNIDDENSNRIADGIVK